MNNNDKRVFQLRVSDWRHENQRRLYPQDVSRERAVDIDHLVVVPDDPSPIVPLTQIDRPRSDVDQVLDEMFGDVDDEGPGVTDAVLLTGGAVAVVAAQVAALPDAVLVGGLAGLGLGSVLPIRSGLRRLRSNRRTKRIEALIGQGHLLDTRHVMVRDLVDSHRQALTAADNLAPVQRLRLRNAAHALVLEVATLLDGYLLATDSELSYASERRDALRQLNEAVRGYQANPDLDKRRSLVEARRSVESVAGESALHHARELTDDLAVDPGV